MGISEKTNNSCIKLSTVTTAKFTVSVWVTLWISVPYKVDKKIKWKSHIIIKGFLLQKLLQAPGYGAREEESNCEEEGWCGWRDQPAWRQRASSSPGVFLPLTISSYLLLTLPLLAPSILLTPSFPLQLQKY